MADRLWRAMVSIPLDSGIPEDAIVNVWHFDDDDDPLVNEDDTGAAIKAELGTFYNSISASLFPTTIGPTATLKCYDMADPEPRVPTYTSTFGISPSGGPPMVNEVALCLSFAAAAESGVPAQRRRGRIYLGPVAQAAGVVVGSQLRPTDAVRATVAAAAAGLQNGRPHTASPTLRLRWSIFSPTTVAHGGTLGQAFNDVLSGWVDDAFDTQRRRGAAPTTRATFT